MSRKTIVLAAVLVGVALAVAGCGGSSRNSAETTAAATTWAGGVCGAFTDWKTTMTAIAKDVQQSPSQAKLSSALDDARSATKKLESKLRSLGAPQTDAGKQAQQELSTLADELDSGIASIQSATKQSAGVLETVSAVSTTLVKMKDDVQSSVAKLKQLDVNGELSKAFADAPECASLTGS